MNCRINIRNKLAHIGKLWNVIRMFYAYISELCEIGMASKKAKSKTD